jgi:hypothetical protein
MKGSLVTRSPALIVLATLAIVVAGCAGGPGGSSTSSATPASSPSLATPSAGASADGATAASPTARVLPPDASLAAEGGDPVVGQLGSFTWGDGGSDSPWLPGAPIRVGAGEPLTVTLDDGTAIAGWTAVRTPAKATSGAGAVAAGDGSGAIGLAITVTGRWTLAVTVEFATGGSATWYWQLEVT